MPEGGRRFELVSMLLDGGAAAPDGLLERSCRLGPLVCEVSGMSVTLLQGHRPGLVLGSSGSLATALEGLQSTLGDGPGIAAHSERRPALEADLASSPRWRQYAAAAVGAGAAAVFAFPLQVGAASFGAMTLHRDCPGPLDGSAYRDAVLLGEIVTSLVLAMQADTTGWSVVDLSDLDDGWPVAHQATGMVAEQLGVGVDVALARLRGHAYSTERSLADVAADVVAGRLRLEAD